ncbi:hypothetical protein RAA17_04990 [Komagataeibacter rhaeticus]|nr:hypothetical protein [Komagataeibacter rhaeticus]
MMGYVTVTGATGLTLDVNPDSSDIILALKTVGEEAALSQLDQFAVNEDVTGTEIVSLKGDFSDSAFQEARLLGVAGIDYGMDDAAGPLLQEITSGGSYDVTGRAVEIGSTTATVLDQQLFLYGGSNATDVVDGDAGTVDYHAGSGSVNYDAAGGDTLFFSGRPSDDVNLMAGSDTVYAFDSTPTVTGTGMRRAVPRRSLTVRARPLPPLMAKWFRISAIPPSMPLSTPRFLRMRAPRSTSSRMAWPIPSMVTGPWRWNRSAVVPLRRIAA